MYHAIIADIQRAVLFSWRLALVVGVISGVLGFCVRLYQKIKFGNREHLFLNAFFTGCAFMLLGIYSVMMVEVTLGNRYIGMKREVELIPFATMNIHSRNFRYVIENVLLFIPLGMLLPSCFVFLRKWYRVLLVAMSMSIIIELVQYLFRCGKTEMDDVVTNVVGAVLGYMAWRVLWKMNKKRTVPWKRKQYEVQ